MALRVLLTCIFALGALLPASASHFRYGHISYTTPDPDSPLSVDITLDAGWRTSFIGSAVLRFGDGSSTSISQAGWDTFSEELLDSAGESYVLVSKTVRHTFATNGDYVVSFEDCCRVSTLVNAGVFTSFRVETTVRIGTDLNSVKAQIPAIIGMSKNQDNDIDLRPSMFDPDVDDTFTCEYHPSAGSDVYASTPQANGQTLSVTSECRLLWDLKGYSPTTALKWAVTLLVRNSNGLEQVLDFVVELGSGATQIAVTGAMDATVGDIDVQTIGLPPSAAILYPGSPTDLLPGTWSFHWVIPTGTELDTYVVNIQWLYPGAGSCLQTVQVEVVATPPPTTEPPGTFGDPHILTWAGEYFDFMGSACDVVLAKSQSFGNGLGLAVHTRLKSRYEYSFIEAAAVQIGDAVLEVSGYGDYVVDGISNAELPLKLADRYLITKHEKNQHDITFTIHVNDHEHILVKAFKDLVSVRFDGADEDEFVDVVGLMGDFKTGQRYSRDRTHIMLDDDAFGLEWQVQTDVDPELFMTKPDNQGNACVIPSKTEQGRRHLGESISMEAAAAACKFRGTKGAVNACIYDVMATGDLEAAAAGAY